MLAGDVIYFFEDALKECNRDFSPIEPAEWRWPRSIGLPKRVAFRAWAVSISLCSRLVPYEAKAHDFHRLHVLCQCFTMLATVLAEEFAGGLSLHAICFERKRICIVNRFGKRVSMASDW